MPDLSNIPTFLLALISLLLTIGGFFVLRTGASKAAQEVENRIITGQAIEIEGLRRKISDLEKTIGTMEVARGQQARVLQTILYVLRQRGLKITIDGDMVTLEDSTGTSKIVRVQDKPREDDTNAP